LGTSVNTVRRLLSPDADLVVLAATEVERRRRHGRSGRLRDGESLERALYVVRGFLPDTDARIDEELVWLRLVLSIPTSRPLDASLPDRWQVAEQGWADEQPHEPDDPAVDDEGAHPLAEYVAEREAEVGSRVDEALRLLSVAADRHAIEAKLLRAHVDGLTLGVCLDRLTSAQAVVLLEAYLSSHVSGAAPGPVLGAGP
ncbi:MAG: hypothetical protein ACRDO4_18150, partial [Nocardioides sp.]